MKKESRIVVRSTLPIKNTELRWRGEGGSEKLKTLLTADQRKRMWEGKIR